MVTYAIKKTERETAKGLLLSPAFHNIIIPTHKSIATVPFHSASTVVISAAERNGTGRQASSVYFAVQSGC